MSASKNFFMIVLVGCLALVLTYAVKPDLFKQASAGGSPTAGAGLSKTTLLIPSNPKNPPTTADGAHILDIIDSEGDGIPNKTAPYLMVINTTDRRIRYYRLTAGVKSVALKGQTSSVDARIVNPNPLNQNPNGLQALQMEIWMPTDRELSFDVEYSATR